MMIMGMGSLCSIFVVVEFRNRWCGCVSLFDLMRMILLGSQERFVMVFLMELFGVFLIVVVCLFGSSLVVIVRIFCVWLLLMVWIVLVLSLGGMLNGMRDISCRLIWLLLVSEMVLLSSVFVFGCELMVIVMCGMMWLFFCVVLMGVSVMGMVDECSSLEVMLLSWWCLRILLLVVLMMIIWVLNFLLVVIRFLVNDLEKWMWLFCVSFCGRWMMVLVSYFCV